MTTNINIESHTINHNGISAQGFADGIDFIVTASVSDEGAPGVASVTSYVDGCEITTSNYLEDDYEMECEGSDEQNAEFQKLMRIAGYDTNVFTFRVGDMIIAHRDIIDHTFKMLKGVK